jgi:hypothetical protein
MNVEIGAEAALFPEKEYIYGIFVAVHSKMLSYVSCGDVRQNSMDQYLLNKLPYKSSWYKCRKSRSRTAGRTGVGE